jgi:hypothetical protein
MSAGDRFKQYIELLSGAWAPRLGGWMGGWLAAGVKKFIEDIEPEGLDFIDESLAGLADNPLVPAPLRNMIGKIRRGGKPIPLLLAIPLAVILFLPIINNLFAPVGRLLEQQVDQLVRSFRFGPQEVMEAWRRDPGKNAELLGDLRDLGWSPARIETLKEISTIIPGVQDLVRMSVREAFSPEIAEKFGQYQDPPTAVYPWAEKIGLSKEWVDRYWAAHWELPSATEGFDMLHRAIITEDELKLLLRARDVMPFWRDKQIKLSWNVPTRVDVRRFWDLRTIDEKRLREVYTAMGYHGQDLEDYILWTKIFTEFPDLLARFKNGWVSLDEVRSRLIALGMKPEAAEDLIQTKIQSDKPYRSDAERSITLTDIYKGVKQGRITRAEAVGLIMDLGYNDEEAGFKIDVNVPENATDSSKKQRQLAKSDILEGLKNGIITVEGARQMLLNLRYIAVDVEFILKLYQTQVLELAKSDIVTAVKNAAISETEAVSRLEKLGYSSKDAKILLTQPAKTPAEVKKLEATRADIILAVKKGLITQEEGYAMLLDLNYKPEAADFILTVQTTESPFSPVNFDEFKDRTQKWRLAAGMEGKPMTEEIKKLGAQLVQLQAEVAALENTIKTEQGKIVPDTAVPAPAMARVKELQATLYKLQAELIRVRTDYNAKIAEWKHAAK